MFFGDLFENDEDEEGIHAMKDDIHQMETEWMESVDHVINLKRQKRKGDVELRIVGCEDDLEMIARDAADGEIGGNEEGIVDGGETLEETLPEAEERRSNEE